MNIEQYIAPDGSGRLHLNDRAVLDGQETVSNQNGVLYLAYLCRAVGPHNAIFLSAILKHADTVHVGKGRFLRRKGDPLRQSHDNVLAWSWWSVQTGLPFAKDIYDFAKWRLYVYNPHSRYSLDPRCWLQPSHIFILSLAANKRPGWLSCIWFAVSCLVADHSSDYYLKSMLRSDVVRSRERLLSVYKRKLVFWALELMEKRRGLLWPWYRDYYRDDSKHPAVLAMEGK